MCSHFIETPRVFSSPLLPATCLILYDVQFQWRSCWPSHLAHHWPSYSCHSCHSHILNAHIRNIIDVILCIEFIDKSGCVEHPMIMKHHRYHSLPTIGEALVRMLEEDWDYVLDIVYIDNTFNSGSKSQIAQLFNGRHLIIEITGNRVLQNITFIRKITIVFLVWLPQI